MIANGRARGRVFPRAVGVDPRVAVELPAALDVVLVRALALPASGHPLVLAAGPRPVARHPDEAGAAVLVRLDADRRRSRLDRHLDATLAVIADLDATLRCGLAVIANLDATLRRRHRLAVIGHHDAAA